MKIPLIPAGIESATFRIVAQHLNHCATAAPVLSYCTSFLSGDQGVCSFVVCFFFVANTRIWIPRSILRVPRDWQRRAVVELVLRLGLHCRRVQGSFVLAVGDTAASVNPLALELDIYSLAHHLCKMWIFYEPRRITLGNTRHFVEE